jgi:hypothetical protein
MHSASSVQREHKMDLHGAIATPRGVVQSEKKWAAAIARGYTTRLELAGASDRFNPDKSWTPVWDK